MKETLKITLVQTHLHWENPVANRNMFSEKLAGLTGETDLIVLPEMFTTGFSMNANELAEDSAGESLMWMISEAKRLEAAITGSLIISEDNNFYNRLFFVFPNGTYKKYDKRHTFTLAGEHKVYTAGNEKLIVNYLGWKICPLVCYDLRFPVWSRNNGDYDVLLYTANWPEKRITAWDALLQARAIENMSYCLGVNRVGLDGNGYEYVGHSAGYNVLGEQISTTDFEKEFIETTELDMSHILTLRDRLQFLEDRDSFQVSE